MSNYMKPEIEIVVFNNKDDNMNQYTYLTASNHDFKSLRYIGNKSTINY